MTDQPYMRLPPEATPDGMLLFTISVGGSVVEVSVGQDRSLGTAADAAHSDARSDAMNFVSRYVHDYPLIMTKLLREAGRGLTSDSLYLRIHRISRASFSPGLPRAARRLEFVIETAAGLVTGVLHENLRWDCDADGALRCAAFGCVIDYVASHRQEILEAGFDLTELDYQSTAETPLAPKWELAQRGDR